MPRDALVSFHTSRAVGATEVLLNCRPAEEDQAGKGTGVVVEVLVMMQFSPEPPGGTLGKGAFVTLL